MPLLRRMPVALFKSNIFMCFVLFFYRLYVLLSGVPDLAAKAVEFSSLNTSMERSAALTAFASGEAKLLVASDAMTRGMDLPSVAAVVNYDAPVYPKTYVHRAGRTARAGRAGGEPTCICSCQQP